MRLLELWRELGRDYVDEAHDGQLKDAILDAMLLFASVTIVALQAVALCAMVPA